MTRAQFAATLVVVTGVLVMAAVGTIANADDGSGKAFAETGDAIVQSYLERMDLKFTTEDFEGGTVFKVPTKMDSARHHLRIMNVTEKEILYLYLNRYLNVPADHPNICGILRTLMEYNWRLHVGKLEWDKSDGEVRLSFTFTTENGVGFEAFEAILAALIRTGDKLWPELSKLTEVAEGKAELDVPDGWVVSPENEKAEGEAGYHILHEEGGMELLYVPGGSFMMGSADDTADAEDDEKPQHEHRVEAFWIGRTEVTVEQWRSVMGSVPEGNDQGDDHPVVNVSWDDCRELCEKTGLRLPGEAEWEYAARGPDARMYPWGDEWDEKKCCNGRNTGPGGTTFPVRSLPQDASWCGVLGMAGNAWEWCADRHDEDAYGRYAMGDLTPPGTGSRRVLRGGAWNFHDPTGFRCACRHHDDPSGRYAITGFRCARDAE